MVFGTASSSVALIMIAALMTRRTATFRIDTRCHTLPHVFGLPPTTSHLLPTSYQALRVLSRRRGFSVAVVATIALVIGINVLVFAAVNAILLKPLPYPHSEQLVRLAENLPAEESPS